MNLVDPVNMRIKEFDPKKTAFPHFHLSLQKKQPPELREFNNIPCKAFIPCRSVPTVRVYTSALDNTVQIRQPRIKQ